jgi:hypothetical protein
LLVEKGYWVLRGLALRRRRMVFCSIMILINIKWGINQIFFNIISHMRIWLNQLDGTSQQVSVSSLQQLLQLCHNEASRLVCQGAHLSESNFSDLLEDGCNVYVNAELEGGKKKKKKKVYTTKKKNKHIHKRVKLGIYTLYSVDGTSSPTQARAT